MNERIPFGVTGSAATLAALAKRTSSVDAARRYGSGITGEYAALQAMMRPAENLRKQLEALDSTRFLHTTIEKMRLTDLRASAVKDAEASALAQIRRHEELTRAGARWSALDSALVARTKAIEELLSPSKMATKYLQELSGRSTLKLAADQLERWSSPARDITAALARLDEPFGIKSARALLESLATATAPFGLRGLLDDAAQLPDTDEVRAEVTHLVQDVTEGVSGALTAQEAVDQIVHAIRAAHGSRAQTLLFALLVPVLMGIIFAFVNPVADFYVKKWLDDTPKQEATKRVKEAAREAVGDVRLLSDYRFVATQSLALRSGSKAMAPIVGQLRFGQTVRVLEKQRDFTLVMWRSEDGKVELQGWAFSRYLKRFS